MSRRTPLWDRHRNAGARLVDFAGWEMPIQYRGIQEEHLATRAGAGLFDVSHMGRIYVSGAGAAGFLDGLLPCAVERLSPGRMAYTVLCDDDGGTIDDLALYRLGEEDFLLVVNAARTESDLARILERRPSVPPQVEDRTGEQAMISVQGPEAEAAAVSVVGASCIRLGFFRFSIVEGGSGPWLLSRSGYTGEDGFEVICPAADGPALWDRLLEVGAEPVGLAARDSLRLEAGFCLYGNELTENTSPLEAGLEWTLALDKPRDFPGREPLRSQRHAGVRRRLVGLGLLDRGIPRPGQALRDEGVEVGVVTSGTHSPVLKRGIAMAYVASGHHDAGREAGGPDPGEGGGSRGRLPALRAVPGCAAGAVGGRAARGGATVSRSEAHRFHRRHIGPPGPRGRYHAGSPRAGEPRRARCGGRPRCDPHPPEAYSFPRRSPSRSCSPVWAVWPGRTATSAPTSAWVTTDASRRRSSSATSWRTPPGTPNIRPISRRSPRAASRRC